MATQARRDEMRRNLFQPIRRTPARAAIMVTITAMTMTGRR